MSSLVHLLAVVCTKRKPRDREREGRLGNEIGRIHVTWVGIGESPPPDLLGSPYDKESLHFGHDVYILYYPLFFFKKKDMIFLGVIDF